MYPEDSVQSIIHPDEWWEKSADSVVAKGMLIWAFIPHVDQVPYTINPVGRTQPTIHNQAHVVIEPLRANAPREISTLPVAAMNLHEGEVWTAYRAKKRPCLVIQAESIKVDKTLTKGKPNRSTAPTMLIAPYFGADESGTRAGYKPEFVERVRHAEYPQFFWDMLPLNGPKESILRLDQTQPIGAHYNSYGLTGYKLSQSALDIFGDFINWYILGGIHEGSLLVDYRNEMQSIFG